MAGDCDLETKYNKIAAGYSKLRSQIPVLKKALVSEQAKCDAVQNELRAKEQLLRIVELEVDSFAFRNQQLTSRVTILQQELYALQSSRKKTKPRGDSSTFAILEEELNKKVKENDQLQKSISECKEQHEAQVLSLMDEITSLKLKLKESAMKTINSNTRAKMTENNYSSQEGPLGTNEKIDFAEPQNKNVLSDTVHKALERQLFETQQSLQETRADRDRLKNIIKNLEDKLKEISKFQPTSISLNDESNNSIIGTMNIMPSEETVLRENSIKQFYNNKIDRISAKTLTLQSKVLLLEQECVSMKCRHAVAVRKNKTLSESLEKERQETVKVQEELSSTIKNYEAQLSAMSDHVAGLNNVILQQKDEIESLNYKIEMRMKKNTK